MVLFTDHSPLATMTQVAQTNSDTMSTTRFGLVQQFWATVHRGASSSISDVLEVSLVSPQLVNWIEFDLARFPHSATIEFYDPDSGLWLPLLDDTGNPVNRYIHQSVPSVLPPASSLTGLQHPQHSFLGHWETIFIALTPLRLQRVRILLTRTPTGVPPIDIYGHAVDYSLAIRNLSVGYQVQSLGDIPRTLPGGVSATHYEPFASTDDIIASDVRFALRQHDAKLIAGADETDVIWQCEPQPDANAVVCLYADLRDASGRAQVVDRIFLDPINNGAHVTLYYANEQSDASFRSPSDPMPYGYPDVPAGMQQQIGNKGLLMPNGVSVLFTNDFIGWNVALPWWFGLVLVPHTDPVTLTQPLPVLSTDMFTLSWTQTGLILSPVGGNALTVDIDYLSGREVAVVLGYDGTAYYLNVASVPGVPRATGSVGVIGTFTDDGITHIALGSDLGRTRFGNTDVLRFVLKEEILSDHGSDFLTNPQSYTYVSEFAPDEPITSSANALMRFHPETTLFSADFPWRIFAGGPSKFVSTVWTPISRDYIVQRGWLDLPATKAKFFKLEFTHLQPQYSDVYQPVTMTVRRFPSAVIAEYRQRLSTQTPTSDSGQDQQQVLTRYAPYRDTPTVVSTGGTGLGYTNTEVYVADDLNTADRLHTLQAQNWNYVQWHGEQTAPRFTRTGRHDYIEEQVTRVTKIGFVIGLRHIVFARQSYSAQYDTPQYDESFYDAVHLASSSWLYDPDQEAITSGGSWGATAVSQTMISNRDVRGVQFATAQSSAIKVLGDSEFRDPTHAQWSACGSAQIGDVIQVDGFGSLLPVMRLSGPHGTESGSWGDVKNNFPKWSGFVAAGTTWGDLHARLDIATTSGDGVTSIPIAQPDGGYFYAATRVVVNKDLTEPLYLQIYDTATKQVLIEESRTVSRGQVAEWFVVYRVNTGFVSPKMPSWADVGGVVTQAQAYTDSFHRADSTQLALMSSGQAWLTDTSVGSASLAIIGNRGVVTSAYPAQASRINVGTSWGRLTVTLGHLADGLPPGPDPVVTTVTNTMTVPGAPLPVVSTTHSYTLPSTSFTVTITVTAGFATVTWSGAPTTHNGFALAYTEVNYSGGGLVNWDSGSMARGSGSGEAVAACPYGTGSDGMFYVSAWYSDMSFPLQVIGPLVVPDPRLISGSTTATFTITTTVTPGDAVIAWEGAPATYNGASLIFTEAVWTGQTTSVSAEVGRAYGLPSGHEEFSCPEGASGTWSVHAYYGSDAGSSSILMGTGLITVPDPRAVGGPPVPTTVLPMIEIGGLWLMNTGALLDSNSGEVLTTIPLSSDAALAFDICPTAALPTGQHPVGVDATVQPWAVAVSINGDFFITVARAHGIGTDRILTGAIKQEFTNITWVPRADLPTPPAIVMNRFPTAAESTFRYDTGSMVTYLTALNGAQYTLSGGYSLDYSAAATGQVNGITASAGKTATASVQVTTLEGTLSGYADATSSGTAPATWTMLLLDDDGYTQLYVLGNGDLVQSSVLGTIVLELNCFALSNPAAGLQSPYDVVMIGTDKLSSNFKASYGISSSGSASQTLIFLINGIVRSAYTRDSLFRSRSRAVMCTDGARMHGLAWTPSLPAAITVPTSGTVTDLSAHAVMSVTDSDPVIIVARPRTWGDVDGLGTYTWGQVSALGTNTWGEVDAQIDSGPPPKPPDGPVIDPSGPVGPGWPDAPPLTPIVLSTGNLTVRLVQKQATDDIWFVDSLALFFDPIVWEMSNNGGKNWVAGAEIRNNPHGALLFLPKTVTKKADQLVYRVSSYAPNTWVSHLTIRPWYVGFMRDVPVKPQIPHGPNLNPQDHYCDIHKDPRWMVWSSPIPREWWWVSRSIMPDSGAATIQVPVLSERFVIDG